MKKMLAVLVGLTLAGWALSGWPQGQNPTPAPMDCSTGPVQRAYGGSDWLVYSCADRRSVVVVSAPGSRAGPFYFMLNATAAGHNVVGEGNGDRTLTDRAYAQLAALSEADLNQLVTQTRAVPKK